MKRLATMAIAIAVTLAWPATGDAQSKKSKVRSAQTAQQHARHAKVGVRTARPCAARVHYIGCLGWDPDPNVRSMIQMDAGMNDQP